MLDLIRKIFLIDWLWKIFAGFYLVAYAFWVPALFDSLSVIVMVISATLILGLGLLADGFSKALKLEYRVPAMVLPFRRIYVALGAVFLFGYLMVYIPPGGRVVAHWPLDMAITLLSAAVLLVFAIRDIE